MSDFGEIRLKFTSDEPLKYGANAAAEFDDPNWPRFVRITDVNSNGQLREDTFRSLPPKVAEPFLLAEGDILLARSGATVGKSLIYTEQWGIACFAGYLIRLRTSKLFDARYIYWYLQSSKYWADIDSNLIQSTIQNVSAERYANFVVPFPPLNTQQRIARFLDEKTAQIDALIEKKRALLERLAEKRQALITRAVTKGLNPDAPMKPSGIDWLGDIPAHWEVLHLRYAVKNLNSKRIPIAAELRKGIERTYPYYGASGIIDYVDEYIFDFPTVLVAEDGANLLSRSTPLSFVATGKYWVNNHAHILKPERMTIWFCSSLLAMYPLDPWISGSAQPKLTKENLGSLQVWFPPIEEQMQIEASINTQAIQLHEIRQPIELSIKKLEEYRAALITAGVTGKIAGLQ